MKLSNAGLDIREIRDGLLGLEEEV